MPATVDKCTTSMVRKQTSPMRTDAAIPDQEQTQGQTKHSRNNGKHKANEMNSNKQNCFNWSKTIDPIEHDKWRI